LTHAITPGMLLSLFILQVIIKGSSIDKTYFHADCRFKVSPGRKYHADAKGKGLSPLSVKLKITVIELTHLRPGLEPPSLSPPVLLPSIKNEEIKLDFKFLM